MLALLSSCAAPVSVTEPCPAGTVSFQAPALDATVPPPSVELRMTVSSSSSSNSAIAVDLNDAASQAYFPSNPDFANQGGVLSVRFDMLPASTAFTVNVSRECPTEDMIERVMVGHWRFRTGP